MRAQVWLKQPLVSLGGITTRLDVVQAFVDKPADLRPDTRDLGRACVQVWLKQPLVSLGDITTRLDVVQAFVDDPPLREALRDVHLRGGTACRLCLKVGLETAVIHGWGVGGGRQR